jgi:FkbM family methyltransferase
MTMIKKEKIIQGLKLLFLNPKLFLKYLSAYFKEKLIYEKAAKPKDSIVKRNGVLFELDFDYLGFQDRAPKQMYFGYYQIDLVEYMRKILKPGDVFIDVGANVGYLTVVAAGLVGRQGQVHSFEPIPSYFHCLQRQAKINPQFKIVVNNLALGEKEGLIKMDFAKPPHSGGSSLVNNFLNYINKDIKTEDIQVKTKRLDDYLEENNLNNIALIKIDVEGVEFSVLKGLEKFFQKSKQRPLIICEITPAAYQFLGTSREELIKYMQGFGYQPRSLTNDRIKADITKFINGTDVVFKAI